MTANDYGPFYAGIGSRGTPRPILHEMTETAMNLGNSGWVLRSGGAEGADSAFEAGVDSCWGGGPKQIFLPWSGFNGNNSHLHPPSAAAFDMAAQFHPVWRRLTSAPRALHARNCHIVLGQVLQSPVAFVLCWTQGGKGEGGTGQAIRVANACKIPVIDMFHTGWQALLAEQLERQCIRS